MLGSETVLGPLSFFLFLSFFLLFFRFSHLSFLCYSFFLTRISLYIPLFIYFFTSILDRPTPGKTTRNPNWRKTAKNGYHFSSFRALFAPFLNRFTRSIYLEKYNNRYSCSKLIENPHGTVWYNYKRNFDLFCATDLI